jgi:hypothetical protein
VHGGGPRHAVGRALDQVSKVSAVFSRVLKAPARVFLPFRRLGDRRVGGHRPARIERRGFPAE